MSLEGSGRFRRRESEFDNRSGHSSFDEGHHVNYEPGTGAAYMHSSGWHNRDAYGNPISPRVESIAFGEADDKKLAYVVPLAIVSCVLLVLIIVVIVLFVTGVFMVRSAQPALNVSQPQPSVLNTLPPRPGATLDRLVNRTFHCEIYIKDQANNAYNNSNSFEYHQAMQIVRNALNAMVVQSTLRDMSPEVMLDLIENSGNDLRVPFTIRIVVLSQSPVNAASIRNVLMSEISILENLMNNTTIDRNKISVRMDV